MTKKYVARGYFECGVFSRPRKKMVQIAIKNNCVMYVEAVKTKFLRRLITFVSVGKRYDIELLSSEMDLMMQNFDNDAFVDYTEREDDSSTEVGFKT